MVRNYDTRTRIPRCVVNAARGATKLAEHYNHIQVLPLHLDVWLYNHPNHPMCNETRQTNEGSFEPWIRPINGNSKLLADVLNHHLRQLPTKQLTPGSRLPISAELNSILEEACSNHNSHGSCDDTVDNLTRALMPNGPIQQTLEHVSPLMRYTSEMAYDAKDQSNHIIGRTTEIAELRTILTKRQRNNPLLVGQFCVGKSSIVQGLALRMANQGLKGGLKDYRMLFLDFEKLSADAHYDNDRLRELITSIFDEVYEQNDKVILVVDDVDGAYISLDLLLSGCIWESIRRMLSKDQPRCIFVLSPDQYQKFTLTQTTLGSFFEIVQVEDLSANDMFSVLRILKEQFETTNISIDDGAVVTAAISAQKDHKNTSVLERAISLIDDSTALTKIALDRQSTIDRHVTVQSEHVRRVAAEANRVNDSLGPVF